MHCLLILGINFFPYFLNIGAATVQHVGIDVVSLTEIETTGEKQEKREQNRQKDEQGEEREGGKRGQGGREERKVESEIESEKEREGRESQWLKTIVKDLKLTILSY